MTYDRYSYEYQMNLAAFFEMDYIVPMTKPERDSLRKWVREGNDLAVNPWDYLDSEGLPLNYLQAYRLRFGYNNGPWDYWKGPDTQPRWDENRNCFIRAEDFC